MPGSSKDAHELVPFLIDGIARKIIEMNTLNGNSMRRFAFFIAQVILARRIRAERALATSSTFTGACGGCDHATPPP
jgi:hypothetical protein